MSFEANFTILFQWFLFLFWLYSHLVVLLKWKRIVFKRSTQISVCRVFEKKMQEVNKTDFNDAINTLWIKLEIIDAILTSNMVQKIEMKSHRFYLHL